MATQILLTTLGTSGDVNPLVGIGRTLKSRGHQVKMLLNPHYQSLVEKAGLEFEPVGSLEEYTQFVDDGDLWWGKKAFAVLIKLMMSNLVPTFEAIAKNYKPGETVVVAGSMALGARLAHEKLGVPLATVHLQPYAFGTDAQIPSPVATPEDPFLPHFNKVRAALGLEPTENVFHGWYHSPHEVLGMFPAWFATEHRWPPHTHLVGFPMEDQKGLVDIPSDLEDFLQAGDPPVVITFGTGMRQAKHCFEEATEALTKMGRRGILLTRYPEQLPATLPDSIKHFSYVPFSDVLPRTAGILYHGGIGTLSQALKAGIPHIVVPFAHDQPDNAQQLIALGIGRAIKPKELNADLIVEAFSALLDNPEVLQKCNALKDHFSGPNGLEEASNRIEALVGTDEPAGCHSH